MTPDDFIPPVIFMSGIKGNTFMIGNDKPFSELEKIMESRGYINIDVVQKRIGEAIGVLNYVNRTSGLYYKDFSRLFDAIISIGCGTYEHEDVDLGIFEED